jgi:hypothetical protein
VLSVVTPHTIQIHQKNIIQNGATDATSFILLSLAFLTKYLTRGLKQTKAEKSTSVKQ